MALDPATLGATFVLLAAVLGLLLLFAWALNRAVVALCWWGAAFGLTALAMGLVNIEKGPPYQAALLVSNAFIALSYGALYAGCRSFNDRVTSPWHWLPGVVLWLAAFPAVGGSLDARVITVSAIASVYACLSAWELWRHAPQRLSSQRVAVVLLLALAGFHAMRGLLGLVLSPAPWIETFRSRWSAEMALFLVVYGPTAAFIFLSMAKERVEFGYKQAALVDPLTGVPNRRAFLQNAAALLTRLESDPVSCLLFDLDNFKSVNDTYGHDVGDRILTVFGQTLASYLPKRTFGRLGGEEFAAILPMPGAEAARLAETVRHAFAAAGEAILGFNAEVTVSVGCASARRATAQELLRRADIALYQAKAGGRNTVVTA